MKKLILLFALSGILFACNSESEEDQDPCAALRSEYLELKEDYLDLLVEYQQLTPAQRAAITQFDFIFNDPAQRGIKYGSFQQQYPECVKQFESE